MVEFFKAIYKAKALTPKERNFFMTLVFLKLSGVTSYKDERAVELFLSNLNLNPGSVEVTVYLGKLKQKKWLTYDTKDKSFILPDMFESLEVKFPYTFSCAFSITIDKPSNAETS